MGRFVTLVTALMVSLLVVASPVHAKKPGSDENALPKGLQKKVARGGELPPGWQKKLRKGEVLDQSVLEKAEPVPKQVRVKLPIGEQGSVDISIDGKVIRMDERTRKILDVFDIAL